MIRLNGKDALTFELQKVQTLLPPDIGGMENAIDGQIEQVYRIYAATRSSAEGQPAFLDPQAEARDHRALGLRDAHGQPVIEQWQKAAAFIARHRADPPNFVLLKMVLTEGYKEGKLVEAMEYKEDYARWAKIAAPSDWTEDDPNFAARQRYFAWFTDWLRSRQHPDPKINAMLARADMAALQLGGFGQPVNWARSRRWPDSSRRTSTNILTSIGCSAGSRRRT